MNATYGITSTGKRTHIVGTCGAHVTTVTDGPTETHPLCGTCASRTAHDVAEGRKGKFSAIGSPTVEVSEESRASAWHVIGERTGSDAHNVTGQGGTGHHWHGHARATLMTFAAEAYVRPSDAPARVALVLEDVMQDARVYAAEMMCAIMADAGSYACRYVVTGPTCARTRTGWCAHESCAAARESRDAVTVDGAPVRGWYVPHTVRCSECKGCTEKRACVAPIGTHEWMPVGRIIGKSLKRAGREAFRADAAYRHTMTVDEWSVVADTQATPVTARQRTAPEFRALAESVAAACEAAGESVTATNGLSEHAGNLFAVALGYAPSPRERRSALAKLRDMATV